MTSPATLRLRMRRDCGRAVGPGIGTPVGGQRSQRRPGPVGLRRLSMSDWRVAPGEGCNSGSARAAIEDLEGTSLTRLWRGARPASATKCDLLREHDKQDDHRRHRRDGEHDRNRQLHHPLDGGLAYEGRGRAAGDDGRPSNPFRGLDIGC
jgi:hypothetical protein